MRAYSDYFVIYRISSYLIFLYSSPGKLHSLTENNNSKEKIYQKELLSFIVREGVTIALAGLDLRDCLLSTIQIPGLNFCATMPAPTPTCTPFGIAACHGNQCHYIKKNL